NGFYLRVELSDKYQQNDYIPNEEFTVEDIKEVVSIIDKGGVLPMPKAKTTSAATVPTATDADLQIVDYSDKAIVLTGDTKPLKDQIKKLGGKFGSRFDTSKVPSGIGWLFPKTKLAAVQNFVAQYGKSTLQEISPLLANAIKLATLKNGGLPLSGNDLNKKTVVNPTTVVISFKKKDVRRSLNSCQNEHGQLLCAFDSRRQPASALAYRSNHLSGTKVNSFDELKKKIEEKISKWNKAKNLDVKDFMLFVALELQLRASTRNDKHFSFYLDLYETNDTITLRISDHHFDSATTIQHPAKSTTSITFSNENPEKWDYFKPDKNTQAVEYVYYEDKVTKNDLLKIADDIIKFVDSGNYVPSVKPNEIHRSPDDLTGWRDWDEYPRYLQSLPKTHIYTRRDDKYSSRVAILDTSDTPWFLDHPEKCEVTDGFYSWECDRNDLIPILLW
ncbi:MAG: hypothetical protein II939_12570, partial [Bacteroidales bacterium]|nr:hypothetical protein [Bacteroidales bacterium]